MNTYAVRYDTVFNNEQSVDEVAVEAAYYTTEDGFVTFKDDDHKQVASFSTRNLVSVTRAARATTIGTCTVSVIPQLDEAAMSKIVREISDTVKALSGTAGA